METPTASLAFLVLILAILNLANGYAAYKAEDLTRSRTVKKSFLKAMFWDQIIIAPFHIIIGYIVVYGNPFGEMPVPKWLSKLITSNIPKTPYVGGVPLFLLVLFGILALAGGAIGVFRSDLLKKKTLNTDMLKKIYTGQAVLAIIYLIMVTQLKTRMVTVPLPGAT